MSTETEFVPALAGTETSASFDEAAQASTSARRRLVWDLPLRAFHWLFAASIIASWATATAGFSWMHWHIRLGYWMIGLLSFRVVWGFVGPRHARFASFLKGPSGIWRYLKVLTGREDGEPTVGHNPLGGVMVIIMLLLVSFQVSTGLFATDDIVWTGPYFPTVSSATAHYLTHLHHLNFNLIWAAIALHIGAIVFYAVVKRQNLVPAMVTGYKPAELVPPREAIPNSALWRALFAMIVAVAIVYAVLSGAPQVSAGALNFD
jgi:cytochrome b